MNTLARLPVPRLGREPALPAWALARAQLAAILRGLDRRRRAVPVACCLLLPWIGAAANASVDLAALRLHVALACGALASAIVLAERWAADPDRLRSGASWAALAGLATAMGSLA